MSTLRERWEAREPIARVAFFGNSGVEEDAVYAFQSTGMDMLSMAIDRRGHLASVVITVPHLIYLVDKNPRVAGGAPADARVFLDGDAVLNIVTSTMAALPDTALAGCWQAMVYEGASRVRALVSQTSIREIVPLKELEDDFVFISIPAERSCELWPELGHKR
jgi:hypothetical protein